MSNHQNILDDGRVLFCWRFQIHVNPFEIVCVRDKITKKEITTGEYEGMKGVWGDPNGENPELGVEIEYRTRYARYLGPFVMHCHILPDEDTGMMQNVQIVSPGQADIPTLDGH